MCKWGNTTVLEYDNKEFDVDNCIVPLVKALNGAGIKTVASCCGHGKQYGNIVLADGRELFIVPDHADGRKHDGAIKKEPLLMRKHIALTDKGWLCPNCLEENSSKQPDAGHILTCRYCEHITLIESKEQEQCRTCKWQHDLKIDNNSVGCCPFQKICEEDPFRMFQPKGEDNG